MGRSIRTEPKSRSSRISRRHRRTHNRPHRGRTIALVAVAILLAAEIARLTVAEAFSEARLDTAEQLAPHNPKVLASSAMAQVGEAAAATQGPPPTAIAKLRMLARVAPLQTEPFLVEGAMAQRDGDLERSEQLLLEARRRDPRSGAARYLLADAWLREGRITEGLTESAALSRLLPGSADQLVPALVQYARTPGAPQRMKQVLAANPQLKRPLLTALAADPANADLILDLEGAGGEAGTQGPQPWRARLLNGLVRQGDYERAHAMWQRFSGLSGPRQLLFNGAFRPHPAPEPFNWAFRSGRAGFAEPGDGAMRVLYYGRENAMLASQLLLLPPGAYRFSVALSGTPAANSLAWTVTCLRGGRQVMELPLGPSPSAQAAFEVPSDCPAQQLQLAGRAQDMPSESDVQMGPVNIERTGG